MIRFFSLRKEIETFLLQHVKNSSELQHQMAQSDFYPKLAFLTDLTQILNVLNKKLQTKGQLIFDLVSAVDGFIAKLEYLKTRLIINEYSEFPCCRAIADETSFDFSSFVTEIELLLKSFNSRFSDFAEIRQIAPTFYTPLTVPIDKVPEQYRMEIIDLQNYLFLQNQNVAGADFWKIVPIEKYPQIKTYILRICSYFGSTYICESTFSIMKSLKTDYRNRLSENHLNDFLRISTTNIEIDFDEIIGQ